jgi:hypothetical protein
MHKDDICNKIEAQLYKTKEIHKRTEKYDTKKKQVDTHVCAQTKYIYEHLSVSHMHTHAHGYSE